MPKAKGKKITAGSIVGILVVVAVFIAQQKGWLPNTGDEGGTTDTPATQNDRRPDRPAQPGTQAPPDTQENPGDLNHNTGRTGTAVLPGGDGGIGDHFRAQRSDQIVTASGTVKALLPDDNDGSRHQKLIVTLGTGQTVLIAHNIDLAERVPCDAGDTLRFRGEYEWSAQGGVVHWTHHDPAGRHQPGWIEHDGVRYQ